MHELRADMRASTQEFVAPIEDVPVRDVVYGEEACPVRSTDDHTASSTRGKNYAFSQFTTKNDTNATRPFDCIIMDPPRSGSTPEFIEGAAHLQPRLIVYISCNPKTMVRDILQFQEFGYTATDITPVDMFPHTPHVESVVLMSKAD